MTSRLTNWLNLSTLRAFNTHNCRRGFSTDDKMEFMIECDYSLEAPQLFDFVTLIAGFFDVFALRPARVNQPLLASTNKERPKEHESALSLPRSSLSLPLSPSLCTPFSWVINETCNSFIIANVTFLKT